MMIAFHSLDIGLGGIARRPAASSGSGETCEYLRVTVMVDEEVSFGAPAARFVAPLGEFMQEGYALERRRVRRPTGEKWR